MQSFASNSNATVAILIPSLSLEVASVIVMIDEDGDLQSSPNLEYQLPGEMLAAASRNYYETGRRFPQTIFALRVIGVSSPSFTSPHPFRCSQLISSFTDGDTGTDMTIYRADFPVHYLQSIDRGAPVDHITIFRLVVVVLPLLPLLPPLPVSLPLSLTFNIQIGRNPPHG